MEKIGRQLALQLSIIILLLADVVLSLAGRDAYVIRYLPFLSLQLVFLLVVALVLYYLYITWRVFRAGRTALAILLLALLPCVGVAAKVSLTQLRGISAQEAVIVASDVLAKSSSYKISFATEQARKSFVLSQAAGSKLTLSYAIYPYGRYVFAVSPSTVPIDISVSKGDGEWRIFVYEMTVQD